VHGGKCRLPDQERKTERKEDREKGRLRERQRKEDREKGRQRERKIAHFVFVWGVQLRWNVTIRKMNGGTVWKNFLLSSGRRRGA
jgi:hypothetical protein